MNLEETEAGSETKPPQTPRNTRPLNLRRLSLEIASTLGGTTLNFGTTSEEGSKDGDNQRGSTADAFLIDSAIRKLSSKVQLPLGGVEEEDEEDAEDEGEKVAEAWWLSRGAHLLLQQTPLLLQLRLLRMLSLPR